MCCECSVARAFVEFPTPVPIDKFINVASFQQVIDDGPFVEGNIDKLIYFDMPEHEDNGWYCFGRVILNDVLIFSDNVPNLFATAIAPPPPPPSYSDLMNIQPTLSFEEPPAPPPTPVSGHQISYDPPRSPSPPPMRLLFVPDPIAIHFNVVDGGDSEMENDLLLVFQPPGALL